MESVTGREASSKLTHMAFVRLRRSELGYLVLAGYWSDIIVLVHLGLSIGLLTTWQQISSEKAKERTREGLSWKPQSLFNLMLEQTPITFIITRLLKMSH